MIVMVDQTDHSAEARAPAGPEVDYLELSDRALLERCDVHTYRASGPGGQKRNKTDSAVRLRLREADLTVIATESRSQHENRARALRRLRKATALELRRPVSVNDYRPSELLAGCLTRDAKLKVGQRDARYLYAVREILDVLAACGGRLADAADLIGVTTGNLSTFLCRDDKLLDRVNRLRAGAGLKALKR